MSALVKILNNPFSDDEEILKVKNKTELSTIKGVTRNSVIYVNGRLENMDYVLKNRDCCVIRNYPRASVGTAIGVGIMLGGAYLLTDKIVEKATGKGLTDRLIDFVHSKSNAVSNQPEVASAQQVENLPTLSGSKNQSAFGRKIPLILGKTYFAPYVLGLPFTTISGTDGEDEYYHCLYLIGYKGLKIEDVSMGTEVLATNSNNVESGTLTTTSTRFPSAVLELRQDSNEVSFYNKKWVQENYSTEILGRPSSMVQAQPFHFYSARYPKEVHIVFTIPALYWLDQNPEHDTYGQYVDNDIHFTVEYSLNGTDWLPCNDCINWANATSGHEAWSSGEYRIWNTKFKNMRYELTKTFNKTDMANCPSKVVTFRVRKLDIDDTAGSNQNSLYVTSVRTLCYDATLTAQSQGNDLIPQAPMAEKQRNKTARLGFAIKATKDAVEYFDKINLVATMKGRTFDGTGWSQTLSPTRNPASIALQVLTGEFRDSQYRYKVENDGADYIKADKIDLDSFGELYQLCNQTRSDFPSYANKKFYCDGAVLNGTKTVDLVNNILGCARSNLVIKGRKYGIFTDKEQEYPLLNLNNNNLLSLVYSKNFDVLPDGQNVKYISAVNYYQQDTIAIKPNNVAVTSSDNLQNVEYPYITDAYHAKSMSLYQQACMKLRPETLQARVTGEGGLAEVGSLVTVQSDVILVGIGDGAEITELVKSGNTITGIKTDGAFNVTDVSNDYGVVINIVDSNGNEKILRRKLATFPRVGVYSELTFDQPIGMSASAKPEEGCIVSFGLHEYEVIEELCVSKSENGDGTYDLGLIPYNEQIYQADSIIVDDFDPKTTPPKVSGAPINYGDPSEPLRKSDLAEVLKDSKDMSEPPVPTVESVKAFRDYIELKWTDTTNANVKETVIELSKDGDETTEDSWVEVERRKTNTWNYYFDRNSNADGYPEADDLTEYRFRLKNVSQNNVESSYCNSVTPDVTNYGTWILPQSITIQKEVIDRTVILTALYNQPNRSGNPIDLYGTVKTKVWISRKGNTDPIGEETFNEYLDVTPDTDNGADLWYTPEFNEDVSSSSTEDTEKNYCHYESGVKTTDPFVSNTYKISHTLPLIGQVTRLFDKDSQPIDMFSFEATDVTQEPSSPIVGDVIHYIGETDTLEQGKYYRYEEKVVEQVTTYEWVELLSKMVLVPTNYKYKIQMFIEESGSESNAVTVTAQALCTNISDIVHSHEHYKDLYVEKLSAINANIGMISQGGMGSFAEQLNYWALSDLNADDSGVAGGIKKGAFRVGGRNEYFQVTPLGNDEYKIELKAGNIELTSTTGGGNGMDFLKGTFVYSADKLQRLALTPEGILIQQYTGNTPSNPNPNDYETKSQITVNKSNDMIIANTDKTPEFGYQITSANVYHFDGTTTDENNQNPQGITVSSDSEYQNNEAITIDGEKIEPLLNTPTKKSIKGTVTKDIQQYTGRVGFATLSSEIQLGLKAIKISDGTFIDIPEPLTGYNSAMREESTPDATKTLGAYLGLTTEQVTKGIFY